jgi:predicted negative regulator of RcsB-dependent stress response
MGKSLEYLAHFLQNTIPKLQTVIQLSGAVVTLAVFFLVGTFSPGNVPAQICGSLTGISIIIFPLAFNFIREIPRAERARFVLRLFGIFAAVLVVFLSLMIAFLSVGNRRLSAAALDYIQHELETEAGKLSAERAQLLTLQRMQAPIESAQEVGTIDDRRKDIEERLRALKLESEKLESLMNSPDALARHLPQLAEIIRNAVAGLASFDEVDASISAGRLDKAELLQKQLVAASEYRLAQIYSVKRDSGAAEKFYDLAVSTEPNNMQYTRAYADLLYTEGKYRQSEPIYRNVVQIAKGALTEDAGDYALSLKDLATVEMQLDEEELAGHDFETSRSLASSTRNKSKVILAIVDSDYAAYLEGKGDNERAEGLFKESLQIYDQYKNVEPVTEFNTMTNLADLYVDESKYTDALKEFELIKKYEADKLPIDYPARSFWCLAYASVLSFRGKFAEALDILDKADHDFVDNLPPDHPIFVDYHSVRGDVLRADGKLALARSEYNEGRRIGVNVYGETNVAVSRLTMEIALSLLAEGDQASAEREIATFDDIEKRNPHTDKRLHALADLTIGKLALEKGALSDAISHLKTATDSFRGSLPSGHPLWAESLLTLGNAYRENRDYLLARASFEEGSRISERVLGNESPLYQQLASALAGLSKG